MSPGENRLLRGSGGGLQLPIVCDERFVQRYVELRLDELVAVEDGVVEDVAVQLVAENPAVHRVHIGHVKNAEFLPAVAGVGIRVGILRDLLGRVGRRGHVGCLTPGRRRLTAPGEHRRED